MSKDSPRWLHEIPKPVSVDAAIKVYSKEEKIQNQKKLLDSMVYFNEITQQEADKLFEEYKKELK